MAAGKDSLQKLPLTRRKKTNTIADAGEPVVAIPAVARIEPVPVELAIGAIAPQVQNVTVAIGVKKYAGYHLNHRPSNTLGAVSCSGSRPMTNPPVSCTECLCFLEKKRALWKKP